MSRPRHIVARDNARRAPAKLAWAHEHDRGECPCGAAMGVGSARRGMVLCHDCRHDVRAIGRAMRQERIAEMWGAGYARATIAQALDSTDNAISVEMAYMRQHGWALPRRKNWSAEGLAIVSKPPKARRAA